MRRMSVVVSLFPLALLAWNIPWSGSGRNTLEYDYGRDLLCGLPGRAVLFVSGDDIIYPVLYLQGVEGFRGDVTVIPEGFLSFGPSRERIKRGNPELAAALKEERWLRTEEEWGNAVVHATLAAGRRAFLTSPSREELASGFVKENRDLVFELLNSNSRKPVVGTLWMRVRGWYQNPAGLTERQRHIVALYALYQRQYGDSLSNGGLVPESLPRFKRALSNPRLEDRDGASNNCALALEKAGQPGEALEIYARLFAGGTARPEIYLNAGNLMQRVGDQKQAAVMFSKALSLAPAGSSYAAYASRKLLGIERSR